jgi:2-methylcitrate dehydratase
MVCLESPEYSRDYLDPDKRSIANAVQVFFQDGTATPNIAVEYPIGHRRRRTDAIPLLTEKFRTNLAGRFAEKQQRVILERFNDAVLLDETPVHALVNLFVPSDKN